MTLVLATPADLQAALQDSQLDTAAAQSAINRASALVRAVARQQLDFVSQETIELVGGERDLTLPQRPVVVDAQNPLTVQVSGDDGASWYTETEGQHFHRLGDVLRKRHRSRWQPGLDNRFSTGSTATLYGRPWPAGVWPPYVRITYSHGYTVCPPELNALVVAAAIALATNPQGLRSEQVGQVTLTWATESLRAPHDLVDTLERELRRIGLRSGGAFSIAQS